MGSGIVRQTGEAASYKGETLPAKRLAEAHSLVDGNCGGVGRDNPFETSHGKCGNIVIASFLACGIGRSITLQ